jgi:hypothetical protein
MRGPFFKQYLTFLASNQAARGSQRYHEGTYLIVAAAIVDPVTAAVSASGRSGCMVKDNTEPTRITPIETINGNSQLPVRWIM